MCHNNAQASSAALCVGSIAKHTCHEDLRFGVSYQCTAFSTALLVLATWRTTQATRICGYGLPYQCTGLQHSSMCVGNTAKNKAASIWGLVCHINAQAPQHSILFCVTMADNMSTRLWDRRVTSAQGSPAQPCALATWQRKGRPGFADWRAISMHIPPAQHCVYWQHCEET